MLINDNFQNYRRYNIPKAQLVIADLPYNVGISAYASSPQWYNDGDMKNGQSKLAGKQFFDTDKNFNISEYFHFCNKLVKPEPKKVNNAGCMIVFCSFEQQYGLIEVAKKHGFKNYINLVFYKNYSPQVLKANMRIVGNAEYALLLYRDKLPKFRNNGHMIFNCIPMERDNDTPKIHPCLPTGEKVFINNKWVNIENAKIGDKTSYGIITAITSHKANKIINLKTTYAIVSATYNHPFLVKRGRKILWMEAEQIIKGDFLLANLKLQLRDILGLNEGKDPKCSMLQCMKNVMARFQRGIKFIIKTEIKQIIELKTSLLSTPLHISGCTVVANYDMTNGLSHAKPVESIKRLMKKIGILAGDGLTGKNADCATSKGKKKKTLFVLNKVENMEILEEKTIVHNLSIKGIPAFDTKIGVSHNTQKSRKLLKFLIRTFTDPGDVVIDPCAGSGITLLAALQTNRRAYGFEIKREYVKAYDKHLMPLCVSKEFIFDNVKGVTV